MARFKKMTDEQKELRDKDMQKLKDILSNPDNKNICMWLSRAAEKSYNTILYIKNQKPNTRHETILELLKILDSAGIKK